MPKLTRFLRQRERSLERTWNPLAPNLLVYNIDGTIYTRTYDKLPVIFNDLEDSKIADPIPVGFTFAAQIPPALVPIQGDISLFNVPNQQDFILGNIPALITSGLVGTSVTSDGTPIEQSPAPEDIRRIVPIDISVGTTQQPLSLNPLTVKRVTILADSANAGTIYISSAKGMASGVGFPLIAGAAKDIGDALSEKRDVDLSTIFIIGTNANDKVHILGER